MNKGGKFIFGMSVIQADGTLSFPPQAIEEYRIAEEGSHAVPRDFYDEGANRIREHVKKMRSK